MKAAELYRAKTKVIVLIAPSSGFLSILSMVLTGMNIQSGDVSCIGICFCAVHIESVILISLLIVPYFDIYLFCLARAGCQVTAGLFNTFTKCVKIVVVKYTEIYRPDYGTF